MRILSTKTVPNFAIIVKLNFECNVIHKSVITHSSAVVEFNAGTVKTG